MSELNKFKIVFLDTSHQYKNFWNRMPEMIYS